VLGLILADLEFQVLNLMKYKKGNAAIGIIIVDVIPLVSFTMGVKVY